MAQKRVLEFQGPKANKRFEMLYNAVLIGGNGQRTGGIEILRREARLLDQLDAISVLASPPREFFNKQPARDVTVPGSLALEPADYDLLRQRLGEAPWLPQSARDVVDAMDWLLIDSMREDQ